MLALVAFAMATPNRYGTTTRHEPNTAARVYAVQSLVHFGEWSVAPLMCRTGARHGISGLAVKDGDPYSSEAPGLSWAAVPVYGALSAAADGAKLPFHWTATALALLCVLLPVLLIAAFFARATAAAVGWPPALVATTVLLLATPLATYGGMFMGAPLATMLLVAGFLLLRGRRAASWAAGGLVLAVAGTVSHAFFVYGGAVGLIELGRRVMDHRSPGRWLAWAAVGALGPVVALLTYNQLMWGAPLQTAQAFLADAGKRPPLAAAPSGWEALVAQLLGPQRGVLFHAPWAVFGFVGLFAALRAPALRWAAGSGLAVIVASLVLAGASGGAETDDLAFSRHLMAIFPPLAFGAAVLLRELATRQTAWARVGAGALWGAVAVSMLYQAITAWTVPYHPATLVSPLWQLSMPLAANGLLTSPVFDTLLAPWGLPQASVSWLWPVLCMGAAAAALVLAARKEAE